MFQVIIDNGRRHGTNYKQYYKLITSLYVVIRKYSLTIVTIIVWITIVRDIHTIMVILIVLFYAKPITAIIFMVTVRIRLARILVDFGVKKINWSTIFLNVIFSTKNKLYDILLLLLLACL